MFIDGRWSTTGKYSESEATTMEPSGMCSRVVNTAVDIARRWKKENKVRKVVRSRSRIETQLYTSEFDGESWGRRGIVN